MRLALALALCLLAPIASAQVPEDPVGVACDVVGGAAPDARDALPVCATDEPAAPQQGEEEASHQHASPAPSPEQGAADLAAQAIEDVKKIPQDPAGAPNRLADLVASIVDFVRGLLDIPAAATDRLEGAIALGHDATIAGAQRAAKGAADVGRAAIEGASAAAQGAMDGVRALLSSLETDDPSAATAKGPEVDHAARDAEGLLNRLTKLVPA